MNNVIDLLKNHNLPVVKAASSKGGEYHSPCPACGGQDRFHVWPEQNGGLGSFWCRGCGKGGDNIQFLIDFEGLGFKDARRKLGLANRDRNAYRSRSKPSSKPQWQPDEKDHSTEVEDLDCWREHAGKFIACCHDKLLANQKSLSWLVKRGIPLSAVKAYRLGLHDTKDSAPSFRPRKSWGLKSSNNPNTGRPQMFVLPTGIVIPWQVAGDLHRIRIRLAKPDPKFPKKKYHAVVGSAMDTFISARQASAYVVVETELDAIMLAAQAGDFIAAAAVGSSHAKPSRIAAAALKAADRVLIALDFDKAGAGARGWWLATFDNARRHPTVKGGDPGEDFQKGVNIRQWLWSGIPNIQKISCDGSLLTSPPDKNHPEKPKPSPAWEKEDAVRELTGDVAILQGYLKRYGVTLVKEDDGTGLSICNLRNCPEEIKGALTGLVWGSEEISRLIDSHPEQLISADNIAKL